MLLARAGAHHHDTQHLLVNDFVVNAQNKRRGLQVRRRVGGRGAEGERRAGPRQCQRVAVGHAIGVAGGGERHCKRVLRARKSSCRVAAQQDNEENAPNVHEGCSITLSCAQRVPHFFTRCAPLSLALALAHCAMHMQVRILGGVVACVAAAQAAAEERAGVLGGLRFTPSVLHQSHTST